MKRVINLEDTRLTYLLGRDTGKTLLLKKGGEVPLEPDRQEEALKQLVEQFHLKNKGVEVLLSTRGVLFREIYLPKVRSQRELEAAVLNEMLYYHSNIGEYTVEFLESGRQNAEGQSGYLVYALRNSVIEEVTALLEGCGLRVDSIGLCSDAMAKLQRRCFPDTRCAVLLQLDEDHVELILAEEGRCILSRRLGIRYASFGGNLPILAEELADQVHKLLQFQRTRRTDEAVGQVALLGDVPELPQIPPLLQRELDLIRPGELTCTLFSLEGKATVRPEVTCSPSSCIKAAGALFPRKG